MKNLSKLILVFCSLVIATAVYAQDYKHPYGLVNKEGKITDSTGKHIGSITSAGVLNDASGNKIAHVDANGNMIDVKTGKVLGRASKNGTFVYYYKETKDTLTVGPPRNGICEVKDNKGKTVLLVHENYKHIGACAVHCQTMNKQKGAMKMKK